MILQKFCMSWLVANRDEVEADDPAIEMLAGLA
jgi:hypothetical protein